MKQSLLINATAVSIAQYEGYFMTPADALRRGIKYPTLAQRNCNPGNIRYWRDSNGKPYPKTLGYVDFLAWAEEKFPGTAADELKKRAQQEGWRVLEKLVSQYIRGDYTNNQPPTLRQMFKVYAPKLDKNDPDAYATFVARRLDTTPDARLIDLIDETPA